MFLKHEGFLGAVGAFLQVHPLDTTITPPATATTSAAGHVSPPHTPPPELGTPFETPSPPEEAVGASGWPSVGVAEQAHVAGGDPLATRDPVAVLECGWSQAAQGIDDFAGAIGGVGGAGLCGVVVCVVGNCY